MAKNKDRINARLAAIKTASAAPCDVPDPPPAPKNKRADERRTVYRFARIILPDRSVLRCIMKDISTSGAKVVLEGAITVPPRVLFKIDQTGETKHAEVVWQNGDKVGLHFAVADSTESKPAAETAAKPPVK